ncbi:MAG: gluconate 2-dehydrogenase subunit 3 family protein [Verrucomicrobia bacterium]|nr:gluconate 2-dehydrogenase subunit 3 family protein [Verrucomicrobiota bacterium]
MSSLPPIDRRTALKWVLAAASTTALSPRFTRGAEWSVARPGYGSDPDLLKDYQPGDLWPLTFSAAQRRTATALCDVIIPADAQSPSASAVGVVAFLDEWVSAPYPDQVADRTTVLQGLAWIDAEAQRRFRQDFASLDAARQAAICDDICLASRARLEFQVAAQFFARFRDLTAGGFYTTPAGIKDLRYVGNVALASYEGPPPEVLRHAGLA